MKKYAFIIISSLSILPIIICNADEVQIKHSVECKNELRDCPEGLAKLVVSQGSDQWKCTGFLISDKILVTNQHCLPEFNPANKEWLNEDKERP